MKCTFWVVINSHQARFCKDGRSYSRESTTNQSLVTLFPGLEKVHVLRYNCKGSWVCENEDCHFFKRFHAIHQLPADITEKKCRSCDSDLEILKCQTYKLVVSQNVSTIDNQILIWYKNAGLHFP